MDEALPWHQHGDGRADPHEPSPVRCAQPLGDLPLETSSAGGRVRTWGRNTHGRCGTGSDAHVPLPALVPGLCSVAGIACGAGHTLAFTTEGALFAWGKNYLGQLGVGDTEDRWFPNPVQGLAAPAQAVVSCSGGDNYSAACTSAGALCTAGCGFFHANAQASEAPQLAWAEVPAGDLRAVEVACGSLHGLALDAAGRVWAWGHNRSGQCGAGAPSDTVCRPTPVAGLPACSAVRCGKSASMAVARTGELFVWGAEPVGRGSAVPVAVAVPGRVRDGSVGVVHAAVCVEGGAVYAWGRCPAYPGKGPANAGQLGQGPDVCEVPEPQRVPGASRCVAVRAGNCHTLMLDEEGAVWVFGDDQFGNEGPDEIVNAKFKPTRHPALAGTHVARIAACTYHSATASVL
eukprot:m51a1_g6901 hypothetical protein (403) ;mRNA; r:44517-45949